MCSSLSERSHSNHVDQNGGRKDSIPRRARQTIGKVWLHDSPQPSYTLPTTRYLTAKPDAELRAADHFTSRLAPAHWPLIWMLVLTQAGIGGMVLSGKNPWLKGDSPVCMGLSFVLFLAGLVASVFHWGQPAKAWRAWLGWRTSWLSREAMALSAFGGIAGLALAAVWVTSLHWLIPVSSLLLAVIGLMALTTQTMVYADTRREFWRFASTFPRFLGHGCRVGIGAKIQLRAKRRHRRLAFAFRPNETRGRNVDR